MLVLTGFDLYTHRHCIPDAAIIIEGRQIINAGARRDLATPGNARVLNLQGRRVIPGLIDLHSHGLLGMDVFGLELEEVIRLMPRFGVTSFLAGTVTMPMDQVLLRLKQMRTILDQPPAGACCLGIHLEGNFFSPQRTGMANAAWCQPLDWKVFETLQDAAGGWIKMVTFAPEEGQAMELIPILLEQGVIPTLGHSDASYEQAMQAFSLGMDHATHTFNAMSPFHHRAPGVVGAILNSPKVIAELIADGVHVHPGAIRLLLNLKGVEKICLVSDSSPVAGLPDGVHEWEDYTLILGNGVCHLADGTLAGSSVLLDSGFRTLIQKVELLPEDAVICASEVPAHCMGLQERKGGLLQGCDADLVVMDNNWQVESTWVGGQVVWEKCLRAATPAAHACV